MQRLLQGAQQLLENNKAKDTAKDPGSQQQFQRLKFNTNDLKNRLDGVGVITFGSNDINIYTIINMYVLYLL